MLAPREEHLFPWRLLLPPSPLHTPPSPSPATSLSLSPPSLLIPPSLLPNPRCGANFYCPGSKITAASSTVRYPCGANKQTTTAYAMSELECTVQPGFGWAAGDASAECPVGMYNPGFNARKCTACPGGLTTALPQSTTSQQCLAGAGFYYLRGKAVACARGTYKSAVANQDCDKCPTGISTANNTVSATAATDCTVRRACRGRFGRLSLAGGWGEGCLARARARTNR